MVQFSKNYIGAIFKKIILVQFLKKKFMSVQFSLKFEKTPYSASEIALIPFTLLCNP